MTKLQRVALITGANKGIGFETARQLGALGFQVLLAARDTAKGEAAAARLREAGHPAHFFRLDVTSRDSANAAAHAVEQQFDRLDVLVNNAGVLLDGGVAPLAIDTGVLQATMEANLYGAIQVTQAMLPLLRRSTDARIINVSSGWGSLTAVSQEGPGPPAYHLSKAALNMWTVISAHQLRSEGISVNSICPGWVRTDMGTAAAPKSVEQGAAIIVKLATESNPPTGGFYNDSGSVEW
ncbi:MAG: SDR family oxidoreductase [Bryobacterales bacterium]|nr:SDR family oxidoreductase [Bryobacterales bacterium]